MQWFIDFWLEQQAQDLIEYSLLIAFVALVTMAFMGFGSGSIGTIAQATNDAISKASNGPGL